MVIMNTLKSAPTELKTAARLKGNVLTFNNRQNFKTFGKVFNKKPCTQSTNTADGSKKILIKYQVTGLEDVTRHWNFRKSKSNMKILKNCQNSTRGDTHLISTLEKTLKQSTVEINNVICNIKVIAERCILLTGTDDATWNRNKRGPAKSMSRRTAGKASKPSHS